MGLIRRKRGKRSQVSGGVEIHVGDPAFDDWPVVADYEDLATARAFCARAREAGYEAEITSDWPLDRFGRGDIALRSPADVAVAVEELIGDPPEPDYDDDEDWE